ncbi:hypothetical protein Pla8534_64040 [Lignipirellula cremea]|uniref:Uncharacterized protein n=2 Tax=Lignipirellula cremea TaxID=2528010 RepID=A0A518E372_9BACT|nr:hypothetical protein Pla8534_64040 [Lignipirellula cremea]
MQIGAVLARMGLLFFALAVAFLGAAPIGFWLFGWEGVAAAGLAVAVCSFAGAVAELSPLFFSQVLTQVLFSMLLRVSLPMGACLALVGLKHPLVEAGAIYQLLVFYLITLIVESSLAVGRMRRQESIGSL